MNSTQARSTKFTPFELMVGIKRKNKEDIKVRDILQEEYGKQILSERDDVREEARKNILKIQEENKKQFNKRRKPSRKYEVGDMVAIQRT